MKKVEINNNEIEFFESSEDLPILRYNSLNKFLMMDNGIGSSIEDFDKRMSRAISFLQKGLKDNAVAELENLRIFVYNSLIEYSPRNNALAMLVYSINGEPVSVSGEGLKRTLEKLDEIGLTNREATKIVYDSKKKIEQELRTYFKKTFREAVTEEVGDNAEKIKFLKLELNDLMFPEEMTEADRLEKNRIETEILEKDAPNNFNARKEKSVEVEMETDFKKLCFLLQEYTAVKVTEMSTFDFFALKEYVIEKHGKKNTKIQDNGDY